MLSARRVALAASITLITSGCTSAAPTVAHETILRFSVSGTGDVQQAADLLRVRAEALRFGAATAKVNGQDTIEVRIAGHHGDFAYARLARSPGFAARPEIDKTAAVNPGTSPEPGAPTTLDAVRAKLGATKYDAFVAALSTEPERNDPASVDLAHLTAAEVDVLPARVRFLVPDVSCEQLGAQPLSAAEQMTVACDGNGHSKYLLAPASLTTADIAKAVGEKNAELGWGIRITFTDEGAIRWRKTTHEAATNSGAYRCTRSGLFDGHCSIAFVLDDVVILPAPVLSPLTDPDTFFASDPFGGKAFTEDDARLLAAQLSTQPLSVELTLTATDLT